MKFVLISPKNRTVYNFRGDLIKEIISEGYEVIVTGPNMDNVEKIEELGARFEHIPLNKSGLNFFEDFQYFIKMYRLLKREKPDITLSYTIKPIVYGAIAAKFAGIKNIYSMVTGVGYVFTSEKLKVKILKIIVSILYKVSLLFNNLVIFQNKDNRDEFVDLNIVEEEKTRIVNGSGVNMEHFRPTIYPKKLTFFMLSRVLYSKGIREYLAAAKNIKEKYPEIEFMLLGAVEDMQDSMSKKDLEPYIEKDIITYYGETNDVRKYYTKSSVFVLPSYAEGTPRTVLEAMAMARPIITTDAPGCRETVRDGENGFLVKVGDVEELEDRMEWFIKNQNEIPKMGEYSLEYCAKKFDINKVNSQMLKYLNIRGDNHEFIPRNS